MSYKITQTHGMFAVGGWRNLKKGIQNYIRPFIDRFYINQIVIKRKGIHNKRLN